MLEDCQTDREKEIYQAAAAALTEVGKKDVDGLATKVVEAYRYEHKCLAGRPEHERDAAGMHAVDLETKLRLGSLQNNASRGRPTKVETLRRAASGDARKHWELGPSTVPVNAAELREATITWACAVTGVGIELFDDRKSGKARRLAGIAMATAVRSRKLAAHIMGLRPNSVGFACSTAEIAEHELAAPFVIKLQEAIKWCNGRVPPFWTLADEALVVPSESGSSKEENS